MLFDLDNTLINSEKARQLRTGRQWAKVYAQIPNFDPYDDLIDTLIDVNNKHPIYIITSSPGSYAQRVCSAWNIPHQGLTAYHDTANHKPHPQPFSYTLERYGLDPDECISFGDDVKDIVASQKAGIRSVACLWGAVDVKTLVEAKADHILNTVEELRPFLQSLE